MGDGECLVQQTPSLSDLTFSIAFKNNLIYIAISYYSSFCLMNLAFFFFFGLWFCEGDE